MKLNVSFLSLLALLFIGLKLAGKISWSWWYVTLPLWGGAALSIVILIIIAIIAAIVAVTKR